MWDLATLAQFHGSEMCPGVIPRLYGWVYESLRLSLPISGRT